MASIARRETKSGDVRWRARYRDPRGREVTRHFRRRIDGQTWLNGVATAIHSGAYRDPGLSRITVREWSATWMSGQAHLKPSTLARYDSLLRVHVLPAWADVKLSDVGHADVLAWVASLSGKGLAPATIRQTHRVLAMVLGLAVRDGRLPTNPALGVRLPKAQPKAKRFLTYAQVADLADAAGEYGIVVRVLALTGLRYGELAALRVGRVDLLQRRLDIREAVTEVKGRAVWGTPKSGGARFVSIPRGLVDDLAQHLAGRDPGELVFTSARGRPLLLRNFRREVWNPATRAAGLDGLTPHGLRHTAASLAIDSGANPLHVQQMLGHSSAAMTMGIYSHLFDGGLDDVAQRMDEAMAKAAADSSRTRSNVVALPVAGA